jgi:hypothetical protein
MPCGHYYENYLPNEEDFPPKLSNIIATTLSSIAKVLLVKNNNHMFAAIHRKHQVLSVLLGRESLEKFGTLEYSWEEVMILSTPGKRWCENSWKEVEPLRTPLKRWCP